MRVIFIFCAFVSMMSDSWAVNARRSATAAAANANNPNAAYNYSYMYPYLNGQMRADLNPGGVTPSLGSNPINAVVTTRQIGEPRRIVSRSAVSPANSAARSAGSASAAANAANAAAARATAAANSAARSAQNTTTTRRIVARSAANGGGIARAATNGAATSTRTVARRGTTRADATATNQLAANAGISSGSAASISSARCLADYTECMNGYCERPNTEYNRCYCSAKLSQIDSQYQPAIDSLVRQIIVARGANKWTDAEMNDYWMGVVGQYSGDNSWQNLDDALNIDWAESESRVRGQQAFATGHDYCVQHLRGCYYMAANLRDAYRSEIARDCAAYESSLQRLKNAAESMLEFYK